MTAGRALLFAITKMNALIATLQLELSIVESVRHVQYLNHSDTNASYECIFDVGYELNTDHPDPTCVNIDEFTVDPSIFGTVKGTYPSTETKILGIWVYNNGSYHC